MIQSGATTTINSKNPHSEPIKAYFTSFAIAAKISFIKVRTFPLNTECDLIAINYIFHSTSCINPNFNQIRYL